ncbi:GDP-L-fucose synthase, partial [Klebsiella pneumoniae]
YVMELDKALWQEQTQPMLSHINVGTGVDCSIKELAETISKVVGYQGEVVFDSTKPDGTPRKLLDVSRLEGLGWKHQIHLEAGLARTYEWFLNNQ